MKSYLAWAAYNLIVIVGIAVLASIGLDHIR